MVARRDPQSLLNRRPRGGGKTSRLQGRPYGPLRSSHLNESHKIRVHGFPELRHEIKILTSTPPHRPCSVSRRYRTLEASLQKQRVFRTMRSTMTCLLSTCNSQETLLASCRRLRTLEPPKEATSAWRNSLNEIRQGEQYSDIFDFSRRLRERYNRLNDGRVSPEEFQRRFHLSELLRKACIGTLRFNTKVLKSSITNLRGAAQLSLREKVLLWKLMALSPMALFDFEPIRVDINTARQCARRVDRLLPAAHKTLKSLLGQCCRLAVTLSPLRTY